MYAKTTIIGYAGADAEHRMVGKDTRVAKFSVAVQDKGRKDKEPVWFRCICWGRLADIASDYVSKGKLVMIEGRMRPNTWTNKDGEEVTIWELHADYMKLLGGKERGTDNVRR